MRLIVPIVVVLFVAPGLAHASTDAGACNTSRAYPASGPIPQNLPGFVVTRSGNDLREIALSRIEADGSETPVAATVSAESLLSDAVQVVPDAPLELGARYLLRIGPCIADPTRTNEPFEYLTEAALPAPTTLGTLEVSGLVVRSGNYSVDVTLVPSAEMQPWLALHRIELWAETPMGPLQSRWSRPGTDALALSYRIAVDCGDAISFPYALSPGAFTAHASATPYFGGATTADLQVSSSIACADAMDMTPPAETPPAGGCTVHGRDSSASAWLVLLAAVGVTVMRRRGH